MSKFMNSATAKVLSIGVLILILLIPTFMVENLIYERHNSKDSAVSEISQKWAHSQRITGPFFLIPYKKYYEDADKKIRYNLRYIHMLPQKLVIDGVMNPHVRYRGIYEAVLYNAALHISGQFAVPNLKSLNIESENILWDKALFSFGLSDMRGIQDDIKIHMNGKNYSVSPGIRNSSMVQDGFSSQIALSPNSSYEFSFALKVRGSQKIKFAPLGEETYVNLKSSWTSPSFGGAFLPTQREISEKGFEAKWKVLHLNRSYPQVFVESANYKQQIRESLFETSFFIAADIYQKSTRISKYALMFIVFTFVAFFFSEIINKNRVHPIQYLLIGFAVILFYVLLLALGEHVGFNISYFLSSFAITVLICLYTQAIIKNRYFTLTVLGILIILYGYLFIVLQLEDYALLMGSIGLLIVLSLIMYITRKIDWYKVEH